MDKKIQKKKWTPKKIASYGAIGAFVLFVLYVFVFSDSSSKLNVEKDRITISTVKEGPFQEYIPRTGTVLPFETFYLDVSEGGRVTTKYVEEGAFLNKGEPIIELENPNLTLQIMYNEANLFQTMNSLRATRLSMEQTRLTNQSRLLQARYQLRVAERKYKNDKELYQKKLISEVEYEDSKDLFEMNQKTYELTEETIKQDSLFRLTQIQSLEMSVMRLEANLNLAKKQLENLTVKAPISGQLTSLDAEIGQSISPGQNLGQIDNIDTFKVRVDIDEYWINRVSVGQFGEADVANETYKLVIKTVYPEVSNGSFAVDMVFVDKMPQTIRRGQTLHIKLELGELLDAVMVDRGGFYQKTGGQWIFVVDESGTFATRRQISLGKQNPHVFEVTGGLEPGEQVITSPYDNFGDVEKLIINE